MDTIVYLFGAGATVAEMQFQGIEHHLSMEDIGEAVYRMSSDQGGTYAALHDSFGIPPDVDIEVMISLLEGCTPSEQDSYREVCDELKKLFRTHLLSQIAAKRFRAKISRALLHIHKQYGRHMGSSGEELAGILTLNYDSVLEDALVVVHGALNYGYPFESDVYAVDHDVPKLLKLHGSLNWRIQADDASTEPRLRVSSDFEDPEHADDYSGWIPPSVYKRPGGAIQRIWDAAADLLAKCSVLRVIGSSLRDQDSALLSLVFTSRLRSRSRRAAGFRIELIVPDFDAGVGDDDRRGIMQRLRFLGSMVNFSGLDIYRPDFAGTGNIYKEWLHMKIAQTEKNRGTSLSSDAFLNETLWQEAPSEVHD